MKTILAILVILTGIVLGSSEVEEVKGQQPCSEKRATDASSHFDEMLKHHVGVAVVSITSVSVKTRFS